MPPKRRQRREEEVLLQHRAEELLQPVQLSSEPINETTLLTRTNRMSDNQVPSAPSIVKRIGGGTRRCSGCQKPIMSTVEGFSSEDDSECHCGSLEAYNHWNKSTKRYQCTVSTRHFHLNPVYKSPRKWSFPNQNWQGICLHKPQGSDQGQVLLQFWLYFNSVLLVIVTHTNTKIEN